MKKRTTRKTKSNATQEIIRVCIDRPSPILDLHKRMYHSIKHNPDNNPSEKGTADHELVKKFVENPNQHFNSQNVLDITRLALVTKSMWQKGTTITISFLDGSSIQKAKVKKYARYWISKAGTNIKFNFISGKTGTVRISFIADPGSWSVIGTECLTVPVTSPTMNFGWLRNDTADSEYERVVVHEFGHSLGCIHEHQNPAGGIHWNKPVVYKYYEGPPNNWSKTDVDRNLFQKYSANQTQFTQLDPNSIMMYPVPAQFTTDGFTVGMNMQLSPTDISFIRKEYPK